MGYAVIIIVGCSQILEEKGKFHSFYAKVTEESKKLVEFKI